MKYAVSHEPLQKGDLVRTIRSKKLGIVRGLYKSKSKTLLAHVAQGDKTFLYTLDKIEKLIPVKEQVQNGNSSWSFGQIWKNISDRILAGWKVIQNCHL